MKKNNKSIKKLLNLKEDYTLHLENYSANDELKLSEGESAENQDALEDSDSSNEAKPAENNSEKKPEKKSNVDVSKKTKDNVKVSPKEASSATYEVNLANVYDVMKKAKTPADVGNALKAFLKTLQSSSIDALSKMQ